MGGISFDGGFAKKSWDVGGREGGMPLPTMGNPAVYYQMLSI